MYIITSVIIIIIEYKWVYSFCVIRHALCAYIWIYDHVFNWIETELITINVCIVAIKLFCSEDRCNFS